MASPTDEQLFDFAMLNPFELAKNVSIPLGVLLIQLLTVIRSQNVDRVNHAPPVDSQIAAPMESKEDSDALFPLEQFGSRASRDFLGCTWRIAQFADAKSTTDVSLYPWKLAQNWNGATLRVRISGAEIAPVLRFELVVRDPQDE